MRLAILIIVIGIFASCYSSSESVQNSDVYSQKIEEIKQVFNMSKMDSLSSLLIGSQLDVTRFVDRDGNLVELDKIEKPIFLQATASWCKPCKALKPLWKDVFAKYGEDVEFVFLTHDTKDRSAEYDEIQGESVHVVFSKSKQNPNSLNKLGVQGFEQIFPFPTSYFIDRNMQIRAVKVGAAVSAEPSQEEIEKAGLVNMQMLEEGLQLIK